MALLFTDGGNTEVDCGAGFNDVTALTFALWVYSTGNASNNGLCGRWFDGVDWIEFTARASEQLSFSVTCAGADADARSNNGAGGLLVANTWQFVAATIDAATHTCKLFLGDLATNVAETGYQFQNAGGGAIDNPNSNFTIGDRGLGTNGFGGRIAWCMFADTDYSLQELIRLQWSLRPNTGTIEGVWHLGYNGTGSQADWSGNGNAGTVANATVADHVPLGPSFGWDTWLPLQGTTTSTTTSTTTTLRTTTTSTTTLRTTTTTSTVTTSTSTLQTTSTSTTTRSTSTSTVSTSTSTRSTSTSTVSTSTRSTTTSTRSTSTVSTSTSTRSTSTSTLQTTSTSTRTTSTSTVSTSTSTVSTTTRSTSTSTVSTTQTTSTSTVSTTISSTTTTSTRSTTSSSTRSTTSTTTLAGLVAKLTVTEENILDIQIDEDDLLLMQVEEGDLLIMIVVDDP